MSKRVDNKRGKRHVTRKGKHSCGLGKPHKKIMEGGPFLRDAPYRFMGYPVRIKLRQIVVIKENAIAMQVLARKTGLKMRSQ